MATDDGGRGGTAGRGAAVRVMMMARAGLMAGLGVALGCSGGGARAGAAGGAAAPSPPPAPSGGAGGAGAAGVPAAVFPAPPDCPDLFRQDKVRTYAIDISAAEWDAMVAEFHDVASLLSGADFTVYHPVVFHLDGETALAAIRLHGQSSWLQAVMNDGDRAKMQFRVAFDRADPNARFHGYDKLVFDMPRSDWTFMHDRLAHAWLRKVGLMASCAASARLVINGQYYGLYVIEENVGHRMVKQFFPDHPDGDLWKAGEQAETNPATADGARKDAFWAASSLPAVEAIVDLPSSLLDWAAEAVLNDADGYYNGSHNFYIYDQGGKGFAFLPEDTDATFDWLGLFDLPVADDHPVFWWQARRPPPPVMGSIWMTVLGDAGWRARYVDAIDTQLGRWDVAELRGWIDAWSRQIADDVATDPHAWAQPADFQRAISAARDVVEARAAYLRRYVECERSGTGDDQDQDGVRWCEDCRDDDPAVRPGAPEVCGNAVDDNCNGAVDEGCP